MARLQDFQTVTPQDTDKLLIVQAAGQGLATIAKIASKIFGLKTAADLKLNSSSGAPTTEFAITKANAYQVGDTETITRSYVQFAVDSGKIRFGLPLSKKVTDNCTVSLTYLETYFGGSDTNRTSQITNITAHTYAPNQVYVELTGPFTGLTNNNVGVAVITGTITFS